MSFKINIQIVNYIILFVTIFQLSIKSAFASLHGATSGFGGTQTTNNTTNSTESTQNISFVDQIYLWIERLIYLFILWVLFLFIVKIIRITFEIINSKNMVYMKITLPKADSKLDKEKETKKDFKEKVGVMSMFYKAVSKMSEAGLIDTIVNVIFNHAKLSMELIYEHGEVNFYVVTYKQYANLVRQHITSLYNDAEVRVVEKKDYIDIKPNGYTLKVASLGKENDDVFPIRTFKYMEDDALNNFTNVFGGLGKEDKAAFQIILKPADNSWSKHAKEAAAKVAKGTYGKSKNSFFKDIIWGPISAIFTPFKVLIGGTDHLSTADGNNAPGASEGDAYKIFNQAETEAQKIMGESAGQTSFQVSMRILCASKNDERAEEGVHALIGASTVFTDEYNNSLDNPQLIEEMFPFIFVPLRYFAFKHKLLGLLQRVSIFSVDEISSMYHFPDITYNKASIINWLEYKKLPPPHNLKTPKIPIILEEKTKIGEKEVVDQFGEKKIEAVYETKEIHRKLGGFPTYKDGVLMGWNEYRNKTIPVYFNKKDRGRHHYIIGKSGGGKSVFIGYLARQDARAGHGLGIIDPHGDLVEDLLAFTPKERAKDVYVFDPADTDRPMGLNMLELIATDEDARKREKDRAAMDANGIFIKIFGEEVFGARIQHYFMNGCHTLMDDDEEGGTLIDVPRLFTDEAFLKYKQSKVKNPVVRNFWEFEYANTGDREKQEMIPYFSSKFGPFVTNTTIRNIIGQPKSAFNIRQVMDNEKILLVNLSKGKIGDLNAQLLGLIFVSKINMAAMARADTPEPLRKDFFLYVDEFQNFATDTFGEILSEARKYKLALIMAHQFIAQIGGQSKDGKPTIKDAVFGNAGTIMSFKVGADDAEYLEKEYAPILSQQDIIGIANFTTYCKLNIDNATTRPFDLKTIWDNKYENRKAAEIIKEFSRKKYGRKKKYVDMEIEARLGISPN